MEKLVYLGVIWLSDLHKAFLGLMDFARAQKSPMENSAGCNFFMSGMKWTGWSSWIGPKTKGLSQSDQNHQRADPCKKKENQEKLFIIC